MQDLLKPAGTNVYRRLFIIFGIFLVIGLIIGYFVPQKLTNNEVQQNNQISLTGEQLGVKTFEGTVTYLGESMYPDDKILYSLTDSKGDDIILLKASDEKLTIVQGLFVKVTGKVSKTRNGKSDVLQVTEIKINNR